MVGMCQCKNYGNMQTNKMMYMAALTNQQEKDLLWPQKGL